MPTLTEDQILVDKLRKRYEGLSEKDARADLHAKYAETWNEQELAAEFDVLAIDGPTVQVVRKVDRQAGTVGYIEKPRVYFAFVGCDDE
jgi:hypothetical protein